MYVLIQTSILISFLITLYNSIFSINATETTFDNTLSLLNVEVYNKVFVVNIYYDERIKSLRLIIINDRNFFPNVTCQLQYSDQIDICNYSYKPYKINNKPHGHLLIPIHEDKYPNKIVINNAIISVPKSHNTGNKYKLSVCICKTVNYSAVNRVIQTIETYRYFGVDHFTIYKTNVSKEVEKVFDYYKRIGIIEIVTWNITFEYNDVKKNDYGQIYKNNDCLYRNMYKSESLIIADWDEIITPVKENNIFDMINRNYDKKYNRYVFKSFLFHTEMYEKADQFDANIPDSNIYSYRQYCIFKNGHVVKNLYTYLPALYEIETHFVGDASSELKSINVKIEDGFIRHTRRAYSVNISSCDSNWMIYPQDKREEKIQEKVKLIQTVLNIKPPNKIIPPIFR